MANWEYHVRSFSITEKWSAKMQAAEVLNFQNTLNELGAQGWEMVSYESVPLTGNFSGQQKGFAYLLFFKRPRA